MVGTVAGPPPADFGMELLTAFQRSLSFATFSAATAPENERREVTDAQLAAACGEAKAQGLRTLVHANAADAVLAALEERPQGGRRAGRP